MTKPKRHQPGVLTLHPRNIHQGRYNMTALVQANPGLKKFIRKNPSGEQTIDFHDPKAIIVLNQSLLKKYYDLEYWQIPQNTLCPPIPGRADYIHHLADLLKDRYAIGSPKNTQVRVLDVGTGASLIYPILGTALYGWAFTASDVEPGSLQSAQTLIDNNARLNGRIELRHQTQRQYIFNGIIQAGDFFHLTMCNPPFHSSADEAQQGSQRKVRNLKGGSRSKPGSAPLNFGGQNNELWCPGGERAFVMQMIRESRDVAHQIGWFTCLISKSDNVPVLKRALKKVGVEDLKVVKMTQGQKVSRFLAWTFMSREALQRPISEYNR